MVPTGVVRRQPVFRWLLPFLHAVTPLAWTAALMHDGDSSAKNCQMLCITHNRAKGNR